MFRSPGVKHLLILLAVLLIVGLLTYGLLIKAGNQRIDDNLANGHPTPAPGFQLPQLVANEKEAPTFSLPGLSTGQLPAMLRRRIVGALADGQLSLEELRGVPVVLNFWASWCEPCRQEAAVLERGWRRDSKRGILYLGLNMQDLSGDAQRFVEQYSISYPTIRDQGDDVARSFGATGIPETYFIDRRGHVVGHAIGAVDPALLATGVRGALSGRVIGSHDDGPIRSQR